MTSNGESALLEALKTRIEETEKLTETYRRMLLLFDDRIRVCVNSIRDLQERVVALESKVFPGLHKELIDLNKIVSLYGSHDYNPLDDRGAAKPKDGNDA